MLTIAEVRHDRGIDWFEESTGQGSYQLILVTYGKCVYWIDGDKQIMEKGELLLIPPGIDYYGKSVPTVLHTKYVVRFDWHTNSDSLPVLRPLDPWRQALGCYELVVERLKQMAEQWQERPDYYRLLAGAQLMEVLVYLSREADRGHLPDRKRRMAESMKQYIQIHYRESVNKSSLGEAVGVTPNYAASLFRSITGQTISDYVHRQRIKTAIYMLTDSLLTIHEIAEYVGYNDASYFHRVFKRITGATPSAYLQERPPSP